MFPDSHYRLYFVNYIDISTVMEYTAKGCGNCRYYEGFDGKFRRSRCLFLYWYCLSKNCEKEKPESSLIPQVRELESKDD